MDMKKKFGEIIADIQKKKPVIHHLTNYVTAEFCADAAYAAGARPIMADEPEEMDEIGKNADAVVINIGTIAQFKMIAMERAALAAKANNKPVILDPVGVMSSKLRLNFALKLLQNGLVTIVRGNYDECKALLEKSIGGKGVDSANLEDEGERLKVAQKLAAEYKVYVALTGKNDYISDGKKVMMLGGGNEMLTKITGSGCVSSTVCACCAAVTDDYMTAAALGVVIMGQAAELAAGLSEKKDGPGMFKVRLIDGIYHVTDKWNMINLNNEEKMN